MVKSREEKLKFAFIIIFVFVVACIIGWCYEMFFYRIDRGMFIKRGQGIGPFLPIYGFGALAIDAVCSKLKKYPALVFFAAVVVTGVIELAVGWALYALGGGLRLWDYNTEIWNFCNIGGFVCLRSVAVFGFAALFLEYMLVPLIKNTVERLSIKTLAAVTVPIVLVVGTDILTGYIIKPMMYIFLKGVS